MLEKNDRLRFVEICCKIKLGRKVTFLERVWRYKLIQEDEHAADLADMFK